MVRSYRKFNVVCVIIIALLAGVTGWLLRHARNISSPMPAQEIFSAPEKLIHPRIIPKILASSSSTLDVSLPSHVNLPVPFTSQAPEKNWDEPWQDACEEAAVLMLDAYEKKYGLSPLFAKDEILKMVQWEESQKWGTSIPIAKVKQLVEEYSFGKLETATAVGGVPLVSGRNSKLGTVKIVENPTVDQIKRFVASGRPVLAVADGKVLPNPHFSHGGPVYHALIIRGYTEDSFITNDPGTQFGENFAYTYQDLMRAIHDWNDGDVKHGTAVVLVVE